MTMMTLPSRSPSTRKSIHLEQSLASSGLSTALMSRSPPATATNSHGGACVPEFHKHIIAERQQLCLTFGGQQHVDAVAAVV
jgi:hypothetical protein